MHHQVIERLPSDGMLQQIATAWDLRNFRFVRKMENIVYQATRFDEEVYLRLTSPFRRSKDEIDAELDWIEHLAKHRLPVVRVIRNNLNYTSLTVKEGDQQYEACLFAKVSGRHPVAEERLSSQFLYNLGALMARMHETTLSYSPMAHRKLREAWFNERGMRHAQRGALLSPNAALKQRFSDMITWMSGLKITKDNYGLVHADLTTENIFIDDDGGIHVIDFDDCCYHWHAFDLAIAVLAMEPKDRLTPAVEETILESLVKGYRSILPIADEELNNVLKFVTFACLRLYFWIEDHEHLNTFHEQAVPKVKQLKDWVKAKILEP